MGQKERRSRRDLGALRGLAAGDLRVREGDIVIVLSQDGEWWEGIVNGERGYFPGNYVKLL